MELGPDRKDQFQPRASASDALLGLYDCFQDPSKVTDLMDVLGAWLDEEQHEVALGEFETHSDRLWGLLAKHIGVDQPPAPRQQRALSTPGVSESYIYLDRGLNTLSGEQFCLADKMRAEDIGRFRDWITQGQELPLILRLYGDGAGDRQTDERGPRLLVLNKVEPETPDAPNNGVCFFEQSDIGLSATMEAMFQSSFSLTAAEMRVLRLLALGENGASIAEAVGRTRETIKSQIKSICGKLGVSSQNEILATVRQVESRVARAAPTQKTVLTGELLELPGGAKIAFKTYGPETGIPLFLVHGLLSGRHLSPAVTQPLQEAGVRLIALARPGYGQTTLDSTNPSTTLQQTIVNMARLAKALGLERISLLTDGAALMFALEFARQFPGLCGPILALDPHPPLLCDTDVDAFEGRYRKVALTNLKSQKALETLFRLAYLDAKTALGPEDMLRRHAFQDPAALIGAIDKDDLQARWENLQENLASEFKHLTQETELFKTDFLHFPPGSNLRPEVCVFRTSDSPYVKTDAISSVADRY